MNKTEDSITFGETLTELMREKGMTQKELSDMSGLSQGAVSRYINGVREPKSSVIRKISDVLGVPESRFFAKEEGKSEDPETVSYGTLVRMITASEKNLTEGQKSRLISLLLSTPLKEEKQKDRETKELFDETLSDIRMDIERDPEEFYFMELLNVNRSLDTPEKRMRCHIISQGLFHDHVFSFEKPVEYPEYGYLAGYHAITGKDKDYFLVRQKKGVWTREPGKAYDGTAEWVVEDINPKYKDVLPDTVKARGKAYLDEEREEVFPEMNSEILIPEEKGMIKIPVAGEVFIDKTALEPTTIGLIRSDPDGFRRRMEAYQKAIERMSK